MATLWDKGVAAATAVEEFTVGNDRVLDMRLAKYDVQGSKAHIAMLHTIGLLRADELTTLMHGLDDIAAEIEQGAFVVEEGVEDIHSQVELLLTRRYGDMGKKIHAGRSRNDQVLVDVKLFLRDELLQVREEMLTLFAALQRLSEQHKDVLLPGYTHGQLAMPSSFGLWLGGYAEALTDDMYMVRGAYHLVDNNPLGSAAGYGNSFPLDRQLTTALLHFASLDYNVVAAQLSRGTAEKATAAAIGLVALTLNKFASDCCLYMCPNFGFISFPDELTTGSSIMPHKKNPDVWEVIRGNCNRIMSAENEITLLCSNMPHGYHRDFQLLKDILFPVLDLAHKCLQMTVYMLNNLRVNEHILDAGCYDHLFTVEEVNRRTLAGIPFREAYKAVGKEVNSGTFKADKTVQHTHIGSIGNLCNDLIADKMSAAAHF